MISIYEYRKTIVKGIALLKTDTSKITFTKREVYLSPLAIYYFPGFMDV